MSPSFQIIITRDPSGHYMPFRRRIRDRRKLLSWWSWPAIGCENSRENGGLVIIIREYDSGALYSSTKMLLIELTDEFNNPPLHVVHAAQTCINLKIEEEELSRVKVSFATAPNASSLLHSLFFQRFSDCWSSWIDTIRPCLVTVAGLFSSLFQKTFRLTFIPPPFSIYI
jgi:hypothetical protein